MEEQSGITLNHGDLNKVPFGVAWGYLDEKIANSVDLSTVSDLISLEINQAENLNIGHYGYFKINGSHQLELPDAQADVMAMVLDVREDELWQRLKEILKDYETKYPDLKYEFTRWDGLTIWN